ncbi:MAG: hypothetical protein GX605_07410 [Chloroflexi bacterium]|nr:hypothetical protein [Chloroflexota bacterium]
MAGEDQVGSAAVAELQSIADAIVGAKRILVLSHVSPDGDAVGSLLGLGAALRRLGKAYTLACADAPPPYGHLANGQRIVRVPDTQGVDLVVALDSSDPSRLGGAYDAAALQDAPLANVDHHVTNVRYGAWNWVEPRAASTCQLVLELVERLGVPLDGAIARPLLHGLMTDTRSFRTSNTTVAELQAAVRLAAAGAALSEVAHYAFNRRPFASIRLWSLALRTLQREGRIAWVTVTQATQRRSGGSDVGNGGLVNLLVTAEEADAAVVFTELEDGRVEVSLRSVPGVDISGVALALGGGGHPQAAGCTVPGPLAAARRRVLAGVAEAIRDQQPLYAPLGSAGDGGV